MKTRTRKTLIYPILVLLLTLLLGLGAFGVIGTSIANAQVAIEEPTDLTFLLNEDEQSYKVRILDKTLKKVTIPSIYNNLPVTKIDDSGFTGSTVLEEIVVPHSVQSIGNNAFMRCTNLKKVLGMSSVKYIGNNAFSMCTKLEYIILPKGLSNVGTSMLRSVKATVYSRTLEDELMQLNSACLTSFTGKIVYGDDLVYENYEDPQTGEKGLSLVPWQNINIDTDTKLIIDSWYNSVTLTDGSSGGGKVLNIAQCAFSDCDANEIIIRNAEGHNHAINLESFAFLQCNAKKISIETDITINDLGNISEEIFLECTSLESIVLPDTIDIIPTRMFSGCEKLSEIKYYNSTIETNHLSNRVKRIEAQAFYNCRSLPELYISENLEFIGEYAFFHWGHKEDVTQNIYIDLRQEGENWNPRWDADIDFSNCNLEFIAKDELNVQFIVDQDGVVNPNGGNSIVVSRNTTLNGLNLESPNSNSHLFNGCWYTTAAREVGTEFAWDRPIKTDLVLYAGWSIKTFSVTFPQENNCKYRDFASREYINPQSMTFDYGTSYSFYIETNAGYYDTQVFKNNALLLPINGDVYTINVVEDINISSVSSMIKYTISYENVRKGTNPNLGKIDSYTVESDTIIFENPSWGAYEVGRWDIPLIQKGSTGNKVIQAIWESPKEFEVKFTFDQDPNAFYRNGASLKYTVENPVTIWDPTSPGYKSGEWQKEDGTRITSWGADKYWENMVLSVKWGAPNNYEVILDYNNGSGNRATITATYGITLPTEVVSVPTWKYYLFEGFTSNNNGLRYYNATMKGNRVWYQAQNDTLTAQWKDNYVYVTLEQRDGIGVGGDTKVKLEKGGTWEPITLPYLQGHYINGYFDTYELKNTSWQYYDEYGNPLKDKVELTKDITLFTVWHKREYYVRVEALTWGASAEGKSALNLTSIPYATVDSNFNYTAEETLDYTYDVGGTETFAFTCWKVIWINESQYDAVTNPWHEIGASRTININIGDLLRRYYSNYMDEDGGYITIRAFYNENVTPDQCVAPGTLITLADGRQIPVEELKGDENLLVWNLLTGQFDSARLLFVDKELESICDVINLSFSDGTTVKVMSEHGFWDYDLNKYVYLDSNAAQYIGHNFSKQVTNDDGSRGSVKVQLVNVDIQQEYTAAYSPVTYGHLCYFVNGMLSMPGGIEGLFNIFEVDSTTMKYNSEAMQQDIATYGLYTYEEFIELVPVSEDVFNAFNGQYLKVAIGKGMITIEQLQNLVARYAVYFESIS